MELSTTGDRPDSDGYTVQLRDSGRVASVDSARVASANDTLTFTGLAAGDYTVFISGLATNCMLQGTNPQLIAVNQNRTTVRFDVACESVSHPGSIRVNVNTTGAPLDPDGYTVGIDASLEQAVAVNGTALFTGLDPNLHIIRLDGVAGNCVSSEQDPQTITVVGGDTVLVTFDVVCVDGSQLGAMDVQLQFTGDPFSYIRTVTLNGPGITRMYSGHGLPGVFQNLPPGAYQVAVGGNTPFHIQCRVTQPNPRTVNVLPGTIVTTVFNVFCENE